jgi:hypothetical protein
LQLGALCVAAAILSGCGGVNSTNPMQSAEDLNRADVLAAGAGIKTPALLGVNGDGVLEYYPITSHGGSNPKKIATLRGLYAAWSMVGNGTQVAILNQGPPSVYLYDVASGKKKVLNDPFGSPVDIAIDKNANLFVLNYETVNAGSIAMYPAGSSRAKELDCKYLGGGQGIAADNEGDIFVNGFGKKGGGVTEIPNGPHGLEPQNCKRLALLPEKGYPSGVAVDPKTDTLIVVDDPTRCAGGEEGRMTIYPKPYNKNTGHSVDLNGHCIGVIRLDSKSTRVFAVDATASGYAIVQRSYPDGKDMGAYVGDIRGMTTIPNTLPN